MIFGFKFDLERVKVNQHAYRCQMSFRSKATIQIHTRTIVHTHDRLVQKETETVTILESMRLLSTGVVVGQRHSWATLAAGRGPVVKPTTLKFELGLDFLTVHSPTKFHHPIFNRSEVIVLTNEQKQTNKQTTILPENIHLAPLC